MSDVNWLDEAQKISSGENSWDPEPGQYSIKFLNDGKPWKSEDGKKEKVILDVEVNGRKFAWFVFKGGTVKSLYGKLCMIAANNGGHLKGISLGVIVAGEKGSRQYSVIENGKKAPMQEAL